MKMFVFFDKISLNFALKGPFDNKSSLVQIMAWCPKGNKPLHEPMMTQFNASVAYRYRKSISIIELFVSIISIYIEFLATTF